MLRIYRCAGRVAVSAMLTTFLTTFLALKWSGNAEFQCRRDCKRGYTFHWLVHI